MAKTMRYIFDVWDKIVPLIKTAEHILLILEYDGTITFITDTPDLAVPTEKIKNTIRTLVGSPFFSVGIISGRSLDDVKKKIGINGLYYGGNNGLEIEGPEIKFTSPDAKELVPLMLLIKEELTEGLEDIEGVIVENKELAISVHYRQAIKRDINSIKEACYNVLKPLVDEGKVKVVGSDKMLEVRPPLELDKGRMLLWLTKNLSITRHNILPIYVGSDLVDESAFKTANKKNGLSIFVGKRSRLSFVDYYLKSPEDVTLLLDKMKDSVEKR